MPSRPPLTYREAGVDIDAGDELIERIRPAVAKTQRPEVLAGLGGFGALFELSLERYRRPILVSGTDGVGTKLKLAVATGRHDTIGIDLVAMCVNDVVVQGAEPLFFLDYYASGRLDLAVAERVITGIAAGCAEAGAALIGGETAEMPGIYQPGDYDLAGFCVGIVERDRLIDGSASRAGDVVLGLPSSGAHSNGYSLIRRLLEDAGDVAIDGTPLYDLLLAPTRIYVKPLLALLQRVPVHGLAHITGGGLPGNVPRMLPDGLEALIDPHSWTRPPLFDWLQQRGNISDEEMYRTFNCGIGMTVWLAEDDVDAARAILADHGIEALPIGRIGPGQRGLVFA